MSETNWKHHTRYCTETYEITQKIYEPARKHHHRNCTERSYTKQIRGKDKFIRNISYTFVH
jgi:hypothetical protein